MTTVQVGFAGFVREHTSVLLRTAYLLTGSSHAAEELVQETFVRLYPKWDRVAGAEAPLAYVRRSLTNCYLNQQRRASSREQRFADVPERSDPRDVVAELAERDEMWTLLQILPDRQRAALVLRFYEGLPDEQIAAALDCRPGTVRSLISRGLAALRGQLAAPGRAS